MLLLSFSHLNNFVKIHKLIVDIVKHLQTKLTMSGSSLKLGSEVSKWKES